MPVVKLSGLLLLSVCLPLTLAFSPPSLQSFTAVSRLAFRVCRGKRLHARNRHLRNPRGFSVAFFNGNSLFSVISQRIVTCPVDFYWNGPMDFQWHFPTEFHFCEFWCVICCPDSRLFSAQSPELHSREPVCARSSPNLPTKIIPTKIC